MSYTQFLVKGIKNQFAAAALAILVAPSAVAGSWQQNASLGGFTKVHVYTPDTISTIGEGRALLIVLHGCTQSIGAFLTANLEDAAEEHGMVIAVPDAMNKAGFGCWSYWQGAVSRTSGDYKNLIGLAKALVGDSARGIDADQVYISGLSSGAAFAAQASCLAPDIFAGVAPSAGPTIGTSSAGAISTCETVSPSQFKSRCQGYAGAYASHFATQIAVIAHGDADTTVNTCYNKQNADGFASVYGVSQLPSSDVINEGGGHTADEYLWQDGRVAMLWLNGLGHTWSAGAGGSGSYIGSASINFASYVGQHFAENNQRVSRNQGPVVRDVDVTAVNNTFDISGTAMDVEGSVSSITVTISNIDSGTALPVEIIETGVDATKHFFTTSTSLSDGLYSITVVGTDNEGKDGDSVSVTQRLGAEPPPQAPVISNVAVAVNGQCATVTGTAVDGNQDLASVVVQFGQVKVAATLKGTAVSADFRAEACDLPGGSNSAIVTASDTSGRSSHATISFDIDAGVTGNYTLHINHGHISWGSGYSACYLEFGDKSFTMRETAAGGGQCKWIADGAPACSGPVQSCATVGGGDEETDSIDRDGDGVADTQDNCPDTANADQEDNDKDGVGNVCDRSPDGDAAGACKQFSTYNYYHKAAGRAYTSGHYWSPSYYAKGSGATMSGSTWVSTTLHSTDGSAWHVGACR